jgi:hypothetical protein
MVIREHGKRAQREPEKRRTQRLAGEQANWNHKVRRLACPIVPFPDGATLPAARGEFSNPEFLIVKGIGPKNSDCLAGRSGRGRTSAVGLANQAANFRERRDLPDTARKPNGIGIRTNSRERNRCMGMIRGTSPGNRNRGGRDRSVWRRWYARIGASPPPASSKTLLSKLLTRWWSHQ